MRDPYPGGGLLGLHGVASAQALRQPPIRKGERLEFVRFERGPGHLAWFVLVRRPDNEVPYEALLPSGTAVKLGLVDQGTVDSLGLQTTKAKLEEETERLARQARLDGVRHGEEVVDNVTRWVKAYWFAPHVGALLGIMEEIFPGAGGQVAEDVLRNLCLNQVTGLPAAAMGACNLPGIKRDREFPWVWALAIGGAFLYLGGRVLGSYARVREAGVKARELRLQTQERGNEPGREGGDRSQGARAPGSGAGRRLRADDLRRRVPWSRALGPI